MSFVKYFTLAWLLRNNKEAGTGTGLAPLAEEHISPSKKGHLKNSQNYASSMLRTTMSVVKLNIPDMIVG